MGWPTSYGYINMTPSIAPSTESSRWLQAPLLVPAKRRLSREEADKTISLWFIKPRGPQTTYLGHHRLPIVLSHEAHQLVVQSLNSSDTTVARA